MKQDNLPQIQAQKYNAWCERRPLVCSDQVRIRRAMSFLTRNDLAPPEKAAFYVHELTGCDGLEFVAFSNAKLDQPVELSSGVILVPCFLIEMSGHNVQDPLLRLTTRMYERSRFIYDGWIPISEWQDEVVREKVRAVDEALTVFCLRGRTFFEWEPKYPVLSGDTASTYRLEESHVEELESIGRLLDSLDPSDRVAIYRSLGWLSQSLHLNEPAARFLFSVLAVESLATYIENKASDESPLAGLRASDTSDENHEKCIRDILSEWLEENPNEAIERAYFDCVVSITQRLKAHLKHVFASDVESFALLFEHKVEGKTLYDLRHYIAHGNVDALSQVQRERIRERVWDCERIARRYMLAVLQALGVKPSEKNIQASVFLPIQNAVISNGHMYGGPTHMAVVYCL